VQWVAWSTSWPRECGAHKLTPTLARVKARSAGPASSLRGANRKRSGSPADVFAQSVPLGRLGSPDDVAEVVALLVSDGANILVDGGMTAR
jgi:NAD(P)-dependent dehydrogenase (short-subunit alcohol dehydrogenase family)